MLGLASVTEMTVVFSSRFQHFQETVEGFSCLSCSIVPSKTQEYGRVLQIKVVTLLGSIWCGSRVPSG